MRQLILLIALAVGGCSAERAPIANGFEDDRNVAIGPEARDNDASNAIEHLADYEIGVAGGVAPEPTSEPPQAAPEPAPEPMQQPEAQAPGPELEPEPESESETIPETEPEPEETTIQCGTLECQNADPCCLLVGLMYCGEYDDGDTCEI